MNKIVEHAMDHQIIYFEYYDYKLIPDKVLDFLLKVKDEVYRRDYAVLFKFKSTYEARKILMDWVNEIESQDDYRYIVISIDFDVEDVGCSDAFDLHVKPTVYYRKDSDIKSKPCKIKSMVLKDHDYFDMKVKNGI